MVAQHKAVVGVVSTRYCMLLYTIGKATIVGCNVQQAAAIMAPGIIRRTTGLY
jgi:hypothetical protein